MTTDTDELVRRLARRPVRVRRLPPPWLRALAWFGWAAPYVALVVLMAGMRPDLPQKLAEGRFIIEQAAALATAVAAGFAAFVAVIPGRARWPLILPVLPLTVWLGSLGEGCVRAWRTGTLEFGMSLDCLPSTALAGAVPALAMALMIRRGAPLYPRLAVGLGGLAAAALGNVGHRLFHAADASLMVLVWEFGSVALLAALAGLFGPLVHRWRHAPARP